jgi:hypothetical protein
VWAYDIGIAAIEWRRTKKGGEQMRYLCIAALLASAGCAWADLLWDNGPFDEGNAVGNGKGTGTYFGRAWLEAADDFEVSGPGWIVNGAHFEGLCFFGNLQVDSVIVAFYEDGDWTLPLEFPFYYEESADFAETDYYDAEWGYYHVDIDVGFGPIVLDPGTYWLQVTPVGLWGDWFYQGCTTHDWRYSLAARDNYWWLGKG